MASKSSSSSGLHIGNGLINPYAGIIPKKFLIPGITYKNFKKLRIKLPARILVIGASGSGKTIWLWNFIRLCSCFSRIYLFAKDLEEPIYAYMIDFFSKLEKKIKKRILHYSNDVDDIPQAAEFDKDENNLVIIDDMINAKNLRTSNAMDLFTMGRKRNVSTIMVSQSYFKIPQIVRQNSQYVVLKKIVSTKDLRRMISEYNLEADPVRLSMIYQKCVKDQLGGFMLIDIETNDENDKYRCGWDGIEMNVIKGTGTTG